MKPFVKTVASALALCALAWSTAGQAASHREAPLIASDPVRRLNRCLYVSQLDQPK